MKAQLSLPGDRRILIAAASVVAALTVLAALLGTWWDEEYTLATTAHGAFFAFHRALTFELQAPLYFVALALWREIDPSPFFARLFSVLCIGALCPTLSALTRRYVPNRNPMPFVLLAVANPFVVYAALEIRLYALALLLSALLALTFADGFLIGDRRRMRAWFVALAIVSIYVQYYLGFALIAGAVALLAALRFTTLRAYAVDCAIVAVASLPAAWWAASQAQLAYLGSGFSASEFRLLLVPPMTFALPYTYQWDGAWHALIVVHHLALLAIALALAFTVRKLSPLERAAVVFPIALWVAYVLAALLLRVHYTIPRHFVALFVPELLAAYVLLQALLRRGPRWLGYLIAATYALFVLATLLTTYRAMAKPGDWPRVGAFLNARVRQGEIVAVFPSRGIPELLRTYHGAATIVAFPRPEPTDRYDERAGAVRSLEDARQSLSALTARAPTWFVVAEACAQNELDAGCRYLDQALQRDYPRASATAFFYSRVVRLGAAQIRAAKEQQRTR